MSLSIEVYIPEINDWVKEAEVKSGETAHIKQNLHGDFQPPYYYQIRCFSNHSLIERLYPCAEIKIGDKTYIGVGEDEGFEMVAKLKSGHEAVEIPLKTDNDRYPHRYRFKQT